MVFERTQRVGGASGALDIELQAMLVVLGPQEYLQKASKGVNRDVRMTLLYLATALSRAEVGEAFGCSYKTVGRVAKKTVARYPEVGAWAQGIKQALAYYEEQYLALDVACIPDGVKQEDVRPLLELINRRRDTLLLLGALPNPSYGDYLAFRALLLEGAGAACDRHRVGDACRERVLLILTAWADRKRLPAGLASLPPRHKKLEEVSLPVQSRTPGSPYQADQTPSRRPDSNRGPLHYERGARLRWLAVDYAERRSSRNFEASPSGGWSWLTAS